MRTAAASRERVIKTSILGCLAFLAVALLVVSNSYSFVLVRRQLAKLEGVETRIRSIIENILDGMITVDEQGVICSMNPAAEKMFGYRDNEMVGHKFTTPGAEVLRQRAGRETGRMRLERNGQAHRQHDSGTGPHPASSPVPYRNFAQSDDGGPDKALRRDGARRDGAQTLRKGNRGRQGKPRRYPALHRGRRHHDRCPGQDHHPEQ